MNIESAKKEMEKKYEELSKEEKWYKVRKEELEEKRNELINEKNRIEKYKNDLYNGYFKLNREEDFILLDDIPSFELIRGKKCIISDYSNIDLLDLCKCLKKIYKRYNIDFKYDVVDRSISYEESDRYDVWVDYNNHPCVNIMINGNFNFYLPFQSIKNGHSSEVRLIQSSINNGYDIKYDENNYKELPFEYKRFITIRDLIYSIAYFKYQNKIKKMTNSEFDTLIYKPLIKQLNYF